MAYNKKNMLKDVIWVCEQWEAGTAKGYNNRQILRIFINIPGRRAICERTLYSYLNMQAKKELREIEERESQAEAIKKMQLNLF